MSERSTYDVVVVGGGDTGMDCVSNALREGAEEVLMLDVYPPLPKKGRMASTPAPGGRVPATEWIALDSSDSSKVNAGSTPGARRASIVFPPPGGP